MRKMRIFFYLLCVLLTATACSDDDGKAPSTVRGAQTVAMKEDCWTYMSLETGEILGTAAMDDSAAEHAWSERTDWDIAFCGTMIRTNSGTSGRGNGGSTVSSQPFDLVTEAPTAPEQYAVDSDTVAVW